MKYLLMQQCTNENENHSWIFHMAIKRQIICV